MKPLNAFEIENLVENLSELKGARLQEVWGQGTEIGLGLYLERTLHWVWFDLAATRPVMLRLTDLNAAAIKSQLKSTSAKKLPVALFIAAHGKNLKLNKVSRDETLGRVVYLQFGNAPDPLHVEVRLFPHGENLIVFKNEKSISYDKVADLKDGGKAPASLPVRSLAQIQREWLDAKMPSAKDKAAKPGRALEKKKQGLKKLKEDLQEKKKFETFSQLGEWIKENQNLYSNSEEDIEIKKYHYRNPITRYTMTSIYDNLDVNGYIKID